MKWRHAFDPIMVCVLLAFCALAGLPRSVVGQADDAEQPQDQEPPARAAQPIAKFLTVRDPGDAVVQLTVENAAEGLQRQALKEKRDAYLILEIHRGSSKFGAVRDLAKSLASSKYSRVRTVAWIPETLDGNNVLLALACKEIVMHPDAEIGDIGLGRPVDRDDQLAVLSLIDNRHNPRLSRALVKGLMDRQQVVRKVTIGTGGDTTETRIVSPEELQELRDTRIEIRDVQTIKEAGADPMISGSKARATGVLAAHVVESRGDLAELYNLPREALREDPTDTREPKVYLIKVEGVIEPVLTTFVSRQIQRSIAAGATHLIFEIDSPGGRLAEAYDLASQIADLDPEQVRTIAYVPDEAISAAAIIALGADEIYLHPNALIGDAGPMTHDGEQFERVPEKVLSLVRQMLKDLAERKNRPAALVMAMADKDLVVYEVTHRENGRTWYMSEQEIHESNGEWIKGRPVPESRKNLLLTLNGRRAHELKLAEGPVEDFETLKQRLGIPEQVTIRVAGRTWVDELVFYLNTPQALLILFTLGVLLIFLDLHLMTGFLGILSALCFGVIFWSRFLGGTAGWLEIVLFTLGLACIMLEIFVMPGFGVFGVSGGLLVFAALIMASQTFSGIEPGSDFRILARTMGTLGASVFCVLVLGFLMSRYLPHMPVFNRMILSPPGLTDVDDAGGPRLRPQLLAGGRQALIGEQGVALSMLRPAGKAEIAGDYLDVVSDGTYIPQGAAIEVVDVAGNRIIVREV